MKRFLPLIIGLLFCTACSPLAEHKKGFQLFENKSYRFEYPSELFARTDHDDGTVVLSTTVGSEHQNESHDFDLYIYPNSPAPNCEHTGITQPLERRDAEGSTIMWGKIDEIAYDRFLQPDCRVVGMKGPIPPYSSAYGLCSVRGDETVFLCLMQMTDNPQLAEEIFSTFRWEE